jgi:hypothetical protein
MANTVVGLFDSRDEARMAIQDMMREGISRDRVSLVESDPEGDFQRYRVDESGNQAGEGAVGGAVGGAIAGGLFGLLVGVGALAFPAIGLVAAGPIAGLIGGAGIGAVSGGIIGALIGWGVPEEHAHAYAESVRRGGILLTVQCGDDDCSQVEELLSRNGAVDIEERAAHYRERGWERYDGTTRPLSPEETQREREEFRSTVRAQKTGRRSGRARSYRQPDGREPGVAGIPGGVREERTTWDAGMGPDDPDGDFLTDFETRFGTQGVTYEQYKPAYRFGYEFSSGSSLPAQDWGDSEPELRSRWEEYNPGTWDRYHAAIRHGFERGRTVRSRRGGPEMY